MEDTKTVNYVLALKNYQQKGLWTFDEKVLRGRGQ